MENRTLKEAIEKQFEEAEKELDELRSLELEVSIRISVLQAKVTILESAIKELKGEDNA